MKYAHTVLSIFFVFSIISSLNQLKDKGCFVLSISLAVTVSNDIDYFPRLVRLFFSSNYRSRCLENNVDIYGAVLFIVDKKR
jgi:hypothetical protein